jgi:16S rRNA (cytosine1402-N4)-methyltransferase
LNEREKDLHLPVLVGEVLEGLEPGRGGIFLDLTLGPGGHAEALLEQSPPATVLYGLDQDDLVLDAARARLGRFGDRIRIRKGNFRDADTIFAELVGRAAGVLFDLGISSFQLDRPERGFAIQKDGPLDMRMDTSARATAESFLNRSGRDALLHAVAELGEEPRAKAIVDAVLAERRVRPLLRTSDLREIVEKIYRRRKGRIHPATRTFQGIRMAVNAELEALQEGLAAALRLLAPGGRLAVISFHSGEDRIVKEFMKARQKERTMTMKPSGVIRPAQAEVRSNRRSRSARLRIACKEN